MSRRRTQVSETACSGEKGQLWSPTVAEESQLWLYDGNGFFDLLFLAVVTIIIHNGLLQRTLPLHMHVLVAQLWLMLCDPMDCSPPESSVHGILQARILELIAITSSRGSFQPWGRTHISCIAGSFFTTEPLEKPSYYPRLTLIIALLSLFYNYLFISLSSPIIKWTLRSYSPLINSFCCRIPNQQIFIKFKSYNIN